MMAPSGSGRAREWSRWTTHGNPNLGGRLETRRKLPPIACAELFLMFSKTLIIEEEMKDVEEARAEAGGVWNPGPGTAAA